MMVSDQIVASVPPSPSPTSSRSTPAAKRSYSRASQQNQTVLLPPSTSFQQSNKSTRAALSPMSGVVDESILAELKVYYCSQVYDAVLTSTVKSLESLLECVTWKNSINLRYYSLYSRADLPDFLNQSELSNLLN